MNQLEELIKRLESLIVRLEKLQKPAPIQPFGAGGPPDEDPPPKP